MTMDDNIVGQFSLTLPGNIFNPPLTFQIPVYSELPKKAVDASYGVLGRNLYIRAQGAWLFLYPVLDESLVS